ncbi:MAG: hypothetical protein AB9834_13990 [Lentimicrobium sp.]
MNAISLLAISGLHLKNKVLNRSPEDWKNPKKYPEEILPLPGNGAEIHSSQSLNN